MPEPFLIISHNALYVLSEAKQDKGSLMQKNIGQQLNTEILRQMDAVPQAGKVLLFQIKLCLFRELDGFRSLLLAISMIFATEHAVHQRAIVILR